jgi:hypothetical protein
MLFALSRRLSAARGAIADIGGLGAVWERGRMPDDREDRRQKDQRDLEFYRQRVRPSATVLWRWL